MYLLKIINIGITNRSVCTPTSLLYFGSSASACQLSLTTNPSCPGVANIIIFLLFVDFTRVCLTATQVFAPRSIMCLERSSSHPTVGVALFGPKVSDQLGSLGEKLPVRMKVLRVCSIQD